MSVLNFMFELDGNNKEVDVNKPIDDKEELDELKKLNRKEIVGSKFVNTNANSADNLIESNKLNNDPLYLLQKQQIHERNKILLNQYKMKQIRRKVKDEKAKKKEIKKKKKRKKQRKKDKKLKQLLLKSLDKKTSKSTSRSLSRSTSRSRSRSRSRNHHHKRRHTHDRKHRDYGRDNYRASSPMKHDSNTKFKKKSSKKYGLILNENKKCGVKIDQHAMDKYNGKNNQEIDRYMYDNNEGCDNDDEDLLKQMMDTADEYDKYRKNKVKKYQKYEKYKRENEVENGKEKDGKFLSEMGSKLYMNHSDTLQSRLNKNVSTLLKRNQL